MGTENGNSKMGTVKWVQEKGKREWGMGTGNGNGGNRNGELELGMTIRE